MINISNNTLKECSFNNVNLLCYEPNTCKIIHFNNTSFTDSEAANKIKRCSNENGKNINSPLIIKGSIILGCIVSIITGNLIIFLLIKKKRSEKNSKYLIDLLFKNNNDEVNTGINKNNSDNNNINNNPTIMENSNDNNFNRLPNNNYNHGNNGNNGNSNVPLPNDDDQESLSMQNPPSYDENDIVIYSNNEVVHCSTSDVEENKQPPEYSEYNSLIEKQ